MSDLLSAAAVLPICIVAFMVGNLAAVGLELEIRSALAPLANLRFVVVVMLLDWLLGPAFAWGLARAMPIAEPYALGLVLMGLAPAAPFLPMMVRRAGGDLAYAACFMMIAAVGTVIFMPLMLPTLAPGLAVSAWTVARPLILLLLAPLVAGLAVRAWAPVSAERLHRVVKRLADAATVAMLAAIAVLHWRGFVDAIGSYAIAAQLLHAIGATIGSYRLSAGLTFEQRSVVSLGACTRNLGAALAPLLRRNRRSSHHGDDRPRRPNHAGRDGVGGVLVPVTAHLIRLDGPGARIIVFMSGCLLRCLFCHNPDTWHLKDGTRTELAHAIRRLGDFAPMLRAMGGGLTISGGEPLIQPAFTSGLLEAAKRIGLHTAVETSGFLGDRASDDYLANLDLVILDTAGRLVSALLDCNQGTRLHPNRFTTFGSRGLVYLKMTGNRGADERVACGPATMMLCARCRLNQTLRNISQRSA
jgi:BASS family bile acid:Na+ symporter